MSVAGNYAAVQIDRAQSICVDLTSQITELHAALARQQDLVEALLPTAVWAEIEVVEEVSPVPLLPEVEAE